MSELTPKDIAHMRAAIAHPLENRPWRDWLEMALDALAEQQRVHVEITRTLVNPVNCKVWRDGVLVFDGVSLDALAVSEAAREEAEQAFVEMNNIAIDLRRHTERLQGERETERARADKAEQERDEALRDLDEADAEADTAEARVAELEAGIKALADEWGHELSCHECDDFCCKTQRLSALLTRVDAPKPDDEPVSEWSDHGQHDDPYCATHCLLGVKHSQCGCTRHPKPGDEKGADRG